MDNLENTSVPTEEVYSIEVPVQEAEVTQEVTQEESVDNNDKLPELTLPAGNIGTANARAFHIVKKRYGLCQTLVGDKDKIYHLDSKNRIFDALLRRDPREVFDYYDKDTYKIPLGITIMQTTSSLYGLTNINLYNNPNWINLMTLYNNEPTVRVAQCIMRFLHASAITKIIGQEDSSLLLFKDPINFVSAQLQIDHRVIICYLCDMIRG